MSFRQAARKWGVSKTTVERWMNVAKESRLDRVVWDDAKAEAATPVNRTPQRIERCVLELRKWLVGESPLGEYGADAILREMGRRGCTQCPSRATVNRILERHDELNKHQRKRFVPPPTGWYLKPVARGIAELDSFDYVEDLCIHGGNVFHVLNGISLHGGLAGSWPMQHMSAENTVRNILSHWREFGTPDYAQFDNGMVFLGGRRPDTLGKVIRLCLNLGVTPVFAPPRETGFQASIESYNGRWQRAVWERFHFENLRDVQRQSAAYVDSVYEKNRERFAASPTRWQIPPQWTLDYSQRPRGKVIFIRRTTDDECLDVMGHRWLVPGSGSHKLIRSEVNLTSHRISFYRLSRRHPTIHEYLGFVAYRFPHKPFWEN